MSGGNGPGNDGGDGSDGGGGGTADSGAPELVCGPAGTVRAADDDLAHLDAHRGLIVKRALLATAVGGIIPIPVMDEYLAGRVKAGMLMKLAERRQVDLATSSAELLGDPREGTALRNATLTAATLLALKLAWRKFFALLAIGRRAEEMATTFQLGTLFDHFCAKMHVGSGIDRARALQLRAVIHTALAETERGRLVAAFQEGAQVLGRSALEAPQWINERVERAARRWAETGGATTDDAPTPADPAEAQADHTASSGEAEEGEARWLDRAARAVERRLGSVSHSYVAALVKAFERRWHEAEAERLKAEAEEAEKKARAAAAGEPGPDAPSGAGPTSGSNGEAKS